MSRAIGIVAKSILFYGHKFIPLFFYFALQIGLFIYAFLAAFNAPNLYSARAYFGPLSFSTARGSAFLISFNCLLVLFTACRMFWTAVRSCWPFPVNLPFDALFQFHAIVGWSILIWSVVHCSAHFYNFLSFGNVLDSGLGSPLKWYQIDTAATWTLFTATGLTGALSLLILIGLVSSAQIRKISYNLFWYVHHTSFLFLIATSIHGMFCFIHSDPTGCLGPSFYKWWIVPAAIYLTERFIREIRARRSTTLVKVILHPTSVLQLGFHKPSFSFKAGQYLYVYVPSLSALEWHPFTITSGPEEKTITVHIRSDGDWTKRLYAAMSSPKLPRILIDGPYGAATQEVFKYKVVVCIGAGIGQTPFSSVLKSIL